MEEETFEEKEDWLLDEVVGMKRKSNNAILNKKKLSKYELDELFASD